jgi:hypothetical protein
MRFFGKFSAIRQHTSAYVSIRQHTSAYVSIRQHTSAYVSIRQNTSEYVRIRQHTSAYEFSAITEGQRQTHKIFNKHYTSSMGSLCLSHARARARSLTSTWDSGTVNDRENSERERERSMCPESYFWIQIRIVTCDTGSCSKKQ